MAFLGVAVTSATIVIFGALVILAAQITTNMAANVVSPANDFSSLMGVIGGVLIADYWILRKQELSLPDLFALRGRYTYSNGVNPKAMIALALAILPVVPGFVRAATTPGGLVPGPNVFDILYTYAWFVTFGLSAGIYLIVMPRAGGASASRRS